MNRMGQTILQRLESLRKKNTINKEAINCDLYRMICNKELLTISYNLIKSRPRNRSPGTDNKTCDGISETLIDNIIIKLRERAYVFKPVRRVYIPKGNTGKTRPLGVPSPLDKIVQKAILLIMESIYEPIFSPHSHGFRPERNCHTALREIRSGWTGMKWGIEGDIKGYYDNVDHQILITILRRKIKDERFIQIIWKLLRAGVETDQVYRNTKIGIPEGGILSPLLANIYLNELDIYLDVLSREISLGSSESRSLNPEYKHIQYKIYRLKKSNSKSEDNKSKLTEEQLEELHELRKQLRKVPSKDPMDFSFRKINYVRYADDWIIGVIGDIHIATEIRDKIKVFLEEQLKLNLSPEKTKITKLSTRKTMFLGYELQSGSKAEFSITSTLKKRTVGWQPRIFVPIDKIVHKLANNNFCTKLGVAKKKKEWIYYPENIIIQKYNYIIRGYRNYYAPADNFGTSMNRIEYILKYSCAHTIAAKRRTRISSQLPKIEELGINISKRHVNNTWDFKTNPYTYENLVSSYDKRSKFLPLSERHVICGSTHNLEMGHLRTLKKDGKHLSDNHMIGIMPRMNSKKSCVCNSCHKDIDKGTYDEISLNFLKEEELI
jgi:retron-type reverse transcriptase